MLPHRSTKIAKYCKYWNRPKHPTRRASVKYQFSSVAQSCPTLCNPMNHSTPGFPVHHQLLEFPKLMSIDPVMPSSHLILCHPLLLLPPIPPSIRVFSNESTLPMRWPKYWSFSFSISPSNEHPGLISLRMDWLNLLAVQGTLKSLFLRMVLNYLFKVNFTLSPNSVSNITLVA